jgi:hypothetical protein
VTAEEEEVTLVMQCHYLTATELRKGREKRAKKATNRETEKRLEVVEDQFWRVR